MTGYLAPLCGLFAAALLSGAEIGHSQDIKRRTLKFSFGPAKRPALRRPRQ